MKQRRTCISASCRSRRMGGSPQRQSLSKTELKNIQTDFAREVGERYGLERGVEGSERTHLSEMRFKAETAMDMANEMCAVAEIAAVERDEVTQELAEARQSLSRLQGEVKVPTGRESRPRGQYSRSEGERNPYPGR